MIGVGIPADGETGTLLKESLNFTRPPLAIPASSHTGSRELSGTMMAIDRNDVLVSSVKMAEDGSGEAIVRLADLSGRGGKVQMQWPESIQEAAYVDAHEQPKGKTRPANSGTNGIAGASSLRHRRRPAEILGESNVKPVEGSVETYG